MNETLDVVIINCDKDPVIPDTEWTIKEHVKGGQLKLSPKKFKLWLSENQRHGEDIQGHALLKEFASTNKTALNATALDWFCTHPKKIPVEWGELKNGGVILFANTLYKDGCGYLLIRCLLKSGGRWHETYWPLDRNCNANLMIAVYDANA